MSELASDIEYSGLTESALADVIKKLLLEYRDAEETLSYVKKIDNMVEADLTYIDVDYNDLITSDERNEIILAFNNNVVLALSAFSKAITEILGVSSPEYAKKHTGNIRARIVNYPVQRGLRKINAESIGKMTSISGMVVRSSEIKPLASEITYRCEDNHPVKVHLIKGMSVEIPKKCPVEKCGKRDLVVDEEHSEFVDFQIIRLQELPEDLPPGEMPQYIEASIKRDLVDNARPGDRIILTGIVNIEAERVSGIAQSKSGLYRLRIDGNNIEFLGGHGKSTSRSSIRETISDEEEKIIQSLASSPEIYERLVNSFAPHIMGHDIIKESILLLIVGAMERHLADGGKIRGDINIFLVGDPGTAKSAMLKFCSRIAPRGLYTSGRGSTAAGLTAAVIRDNKSGMMMLEAGAVVLGDQGLVCIDEFDKLRAEDSSALHEVMEQQSASVAKGGIVATLNARTSILAAANPLYGKYDPYKYLTDNINLPIPLLTRFDLIFVVQDKPSAEHDLEVANHIINLHSSSSSASRSQIEPDLLTKYLTYAKRFDPQLTPEAIKIITDYYLKMRRVESDQMITVTPRQLEGLVRLASARARLLLKTRVDAEDAERAIFLIQHMLGKIGVDLETGQIDMGILHGKSKKDMAKLDLFMTILRGLMGGPRGSVDEKTLIGELVTSTKFTEDDANKYIAKMLSDGTIYEPKSGYYGIA